MFSDNGMISSRQLKRQMVLSFLGVLLLLGTGEAAGGGGNALLGFFLGILLLLAYLFLLVRTAEVYRAPEKYLGLPGKWLLTGGYLSYLALSGGVLLEEISRVVQIYLLPSVPQPVIGAVFLGAAFLGMGQKIQKRGRLAEVSYPWVLGIFLLLLLLSVPHLHGIPAEAGRLLPGASQRDLAAGPDHFGNRGNSRGSLRVERRSAAGIPHFKPDDGNRHSRGISGAGGYYLAGSAAFYPAFCYGKHSVLRSLDRCGRKPGDSLEKAAAGGGNLAAEPDPLAGKHGCQDLRQAAAGCLGPGFIGNYPAGSVGQKESGAWN